MAWPEWAQRAWEPVAPYAERAAVWRGYEAELQTLIIFAIGIALYSTFVFAFYQNVGKRDAWHSKRKPGAWGWFVNFAESWLVFPAMSFVYFALLAGSLFLLAKSQSVFQIFLIAMSVVVGVRVVAYASEGAASDLAKVLPLGLLGVLLVDPSTINRALVFERFGEIPQQAPLLARYFLLFLVLETLLKSVRSVMVRIGDRMALRKASKPLKRETLAATVSHDAHGMPARSVPVKGPSPKAKEGPAAPEHHGFHEIE